MLTSSALKALGKGKSEPSFENLKAHTAVVVWAFPEAGAVVGGVGGAVGAEAPVPLAVGTDYVVADERPFGLG